MKKIKILVSLLLAATCAFACVVGGCSCSNKEEIAVDESGNIYANYSYVPSEKEVLIYGFDEIGDFQQLNTTSPFGKIKPNTNKDYVSQGEGSMEVSVEGYEDVMHFPEATYALKQYIYMYPRMYWEDTNMLDVSAFILDVYNDNDTAQKIWLYIKGTTNELLCEAVDVLPGVWTACIFEIDMDRSYYQGLGDVSEISIAFENREPGEDPKHYYLDNFRCVKEDEKSTRLTAPEFDGSTICDYEDEYFYNTAVNIFQSSPQGNVFGQPKVELNDNPEFVKTGEHSLKVTRYPNKQQRTMLGGYYDITAVHTHFLQQIDFKYYANNGYAIKMDLYLDYSREIDLTISLASADVAANHNIVIYPGWNEIVYDMDRSDIDWSMASYFNLLMSEFFDSENAVMYLDNVRFEKVDDATPELPPQTPEQGDDDKDDEEEEYVGWNPNLPIDTTMDFSDAEYKYTHTGKYMTMTAFFIETDLPLNTNVYLSLKVKTNLSYDWCGLFYVGTSNDCVIGMGAGENTWPYLKNCTDWTETYVETKVTTGENAFNVLDSWVGEDLTKMGMVIDKSKTGIFVMVVNHQVNATVALKDVQIVAK